MKTMRFWSGSPAVPFLALMMIGGLFSGPVAGQELDHDETQPIEISADSLEVAQEERVATFVGNVDAVQGDLVLSAQTLKVHYEGKDRAVGLAAGTGGTINQIEASGAVILSSPEETAEGDLGVYDVPARLITLTGDVVLTRGDNVLQGEHLELDLATGKSRMIGTTAAVETAEGDQTSTERVKALFTPKQKDPRKETGNDASSPPLPAAKPK